MRTTHQLLNALADAGLVVDENALRHALRAGRLAPPSDRVGHLYAWNEDDVARAFAWARRRAAKREGRR
jgi:hypothetical protein